MINRVRTRDLRATATRSFPETAGVDRVERLGWRERRRRLRLARRGGRYLFRGRFVPRTLRAVAFCAVVTGSVVGVLGAIGYSTYVNDVAQARRDGGGGPVAAPAGRDPKADPGGRSAVVHGQVAIVSAGRLATAVAVADDGESRWYVTGYEPVEAAVFVNGPAVMYRDGSVTLEPWRWDPTAGLAVLVGPSTGEPVRPVDDRWRGQDGEVVSVVGIRGGDVVLLPAMAAEVESSSVRVGVDTTAVEVGSAVVDDTGLLVGVVTAVDDGTALVARTGLICSTVLSCSR